MKICKKIFIYLILFLLTLNFISPLYSFADDTSNLNIYSTAAVLMDNATGKILYEKNSNKKMYPASLTKILTAVITLEKCNLMDIATVSYDSVMTLDSGYVTANLQIGEELTVEQLLYVLMVASSNDAAIVLAEHISRFC